MSVWLIEPLDPLIARDGRPAAVGRFSTVPFPYPSMTAGAVRTRLGSEGGAFTLPVDALEDLKKVEVRGPLLAKLDAETDEVLEWLLPAPRDAAVLRDPEEQPAIFALRPRPLAPGEAMDSLGNEGLLPLTTSGEVGTSKPPEGIPSFWKWEEMKSWLINPGDRHSVDLSSLGIRKLPIETRANLALQPGERVGIDGMLFQTSGLRFLYQEKEEDDRRLSPQRLALSVGCPGGSAGGRALALEEQIAPLGGERRLARWRQSSQAWPTLPEEVRESVVKKRRARLILLTPAIFSNGALPGWNGKLWPWGNKALEVTVKAACVPRPEVVSGWDLAASNGNGKPKGRPKPTRRLACAGSVYFVELEGGSEADVRRWCEETWLACVSDDLQGRRDGFGMVALGTWEEERS